MLMIVAVMMGADMANTMLVGTYLAWLLDV